MKRKFVFFRNRLTALALLTTVALTGCSSASDPNIKEAISLLEPEAADDNIYTEPVIRRTLYSSSLYTSTVSPYIEEYSFDSAQQFGSYGPLLGEQVRKGDVLMTASGEALSSQIETLEERLQDLKDNYMDYREEAEKELKDLQEELSELQIILNNMDRMEPPIPESVDDTGFSENDPDNPDSIDSAATVSGGNAGSPENNPDYPYPDHASWQAERDRWQSEYNLVDHYIATSQLALDKQQKLYELDYEYYNVHLQELLAQRSDETIRSQISGVVVALGDYVYGTYIPKNQPVIAVADLTQKYIRCDHIRERYINGADQLYAFINGKRYEVTLYDNNVIYPDQTTFILHDDQDEVPMGSYVVLVLLSDYREQVLTVRTDSIYTESSKDYVYVLEDGRTVVKEITRGASDSLYTEILSGLSEGDAVLVPDAPQTGSSYATLEKETFSNPCILHGEFVYPIQTVVTNPVTYGKVFLERYKVKENQYVQEGSPLASIGVEPDLIALNRREVSLQRRKERLNDLIAMNRKEDEENIRLTQESIQEEEETLAQIRADYAATEILAPVSGNLVFLWSRTSGEIIPADAVIGYIADDTIAYLSISETNGIYASYNTPLLISCKDHDGKLIETTCTALTVDNSLLSDALKGDAKAFIPYEIRQNMVYSTKSPINVFFESNEMKNVILIPKKAVTLVDGNTYVNIQNPDGSVSTISFLCGGSDREHYWAIDGLTEGMIICWE